MFTHAKLLNYQLLFLLSWTTKGLERIFWTSSFQPNTTLASCLCHSKSMHSRATNDSLRPEPHTFLRSSHSSGPPWLSPSLAFLAPHSPSGPPFFSAPVLYSCSPAQSPSVSSAMEIWASLQNLCQLPFTSGSPERPARVLLCCSHCLSHACSSSLGSLIVIWSAPLCSTSPLVCEFLEDKTKSYLSVYVQV